MDCGLPVRWHCSECGTDIEEMNNCCMDRLYYLEGEYKKKCSLSAKKAHETRILNIKKRHDTSILDRLCKR